MIGMKFSIITLFPEVIEPYLKSSIINRAQKKGLVEFEIINLRDFGKGNHKIVDDRPYGGGAGMILKADVLTKAWQTVVQSSEFRVQSKNSKSPISEPPTPNPYTILTSPSGEPFKQARARRLLKFNHIILICGHYEGVDERFIEKYVDEEISIGDYVLTGGEIPALVIADSVTRLIKGVLKKEEAVLYESFENNLLEYPQFTRPEVFNGTRVPKILTSGNHKAIIEWRQKKALEKTKKFRSDLLKKASGDLKVHLLKGV